MSRGLGDVYKRQLMSVMNVVLITYAGKVNVANATLGIQLPKLDLLRQMHALMTDLAVMLEVLVRAKYKN